MFFGTHHGWIRCVRCGALACLKAIYDVPHTSILLPMLYFTSFGFGLVSIVFKQNTWLRPALIALMGTSILHHSKSHERYRGKDAVGMVDRTLAHAVVIGALHEATTHPSNLPLNIFYASCLGWVTYVYKVSKLCFLPKPHGEAFHASMHIAACLALTAIGLRSRHI
jgi:hypothetical protein